VVTTAGFSVSAHDPTLFVHVSPRGRTLLLLYVDGMVITSDDPEYIAFVKAHLSDQFLISDFGPLRYLGLRSPPLLNGSFCLKGSIFRIFSIKLLLLITGLRSSPMELNVHLTNTDVEPPEDPTCYHHIVGSLIYHGVTRPDISYSVHILSQFVYALTQIHYSHLLRVLRYLRGTISHHLFFFML
jgi:hypothetical protein